MKILNSAPTNLGPKNQIYHKVVEISKGIIQWFSKIKFSIFFKNLFRLTNLNPIQLIVISFESLLFWDTHFTISPVTIIMKNSKYQTILNHEFSTLNLHQLDLLKFGHICEYQMYCRW